MFSFPEKYKRPSSWIDEIEIHNYLVPCRGGHLSIGASIEPFWEHVSVVKLSGDLAKTPCWDEMCQIKDMFWDKENEVLQFHPRESEYVNFHSKCLHLWRPTEDNKDYIRR